VNCGRLCRGKRLSKEEKKTFKEKQRKGKERQNDFARGEAKSTSKGGPRDGVRNSLPISG